MRGGGFTPAPTAMQLIPRLGYQAILKVREFSVADHCGDGISGRRVSLLRESLPSFHFTISFCWYSTALWEGRFRITADRN